MWFRQNKKARGKVRHCGLRFRQTQINFSQICPWSLVFAYSRTAPIGILLVLPDFDNTRSSCQFAVLWYLPSTIRLSYNNCASTVFYLGEALSRGQPNNGFCSIKELFARRCKSDCRNRQCLEDSNSPHFMFTPMNHPTGDHLESSLHSKVEDGGKKQAKFLWSPPRRRDFAIERDTSLVWTGSVSATSWSCSAAAARKRSQKEDRVSVLRITTMSIARRFAKP